MKKTLIVHNSHSAQNRNLPTLTKTNQEAITSNDTQTGEKPSSSLSDKEFLKSLAKYLTSIDTLLKSPKNFMKKLKLKKITNLASRMNKKKSSIFLNFITVMYEVGEIERNIFAFAACLFRKAVDRFRHRVFEEGDSLMLFSSCLFLSIKLLLDHERWYIEDYAYISGISEKVVEKAELKLLVEVFEFNISFDFKQIQDLETILEVLFLKDNRKIKSKKNVFLIKTLGKKSKNRHRKNSHMRIYDNMPTLEF